MRVSDRPMPKSRAKNIHASMSPSTAALSGFAGTISVTRSIPDFGACALASDRGALGGARDHPRPGLVGEPLAGLEHVDQHQTEEHGDRRHHHRVGERLEADPPEALQVAEAGDPEHQGREDERHDQHEQQPEEDLPHRLRRRA